MGVWGLFSERTFISTTFSKKPDTKSHRDEDVLLEPAAQQPFPFPLLLRTSRTNPIRPWSHEDGSNGLFQAISMIVERFVHKGTTRINNHKLWKSQALCTASFLTHTEYIFPLLSLWFWFRKHWAIFNSPCQVNALPALCFQRTIHGFGRAWLSCSTHFPSRDAAEAAAVSGQALRVLSWVLDVKIKVLPRSDWRSSMDIMESCKCLWRSNGPTSYCWWNAGVRKQQLSCRGGNAVVWPWAEQGKDNSTKLLSATSLPFGEGNSTRTLEEMHHLFSQCFPSKEGPLLAMNSTLVPWNCKRPFIPHRVAEHTKISWVAHVWTWRTSSTPGSRKFSPQSRLTTVTG